MNRLIARTNLFDDFFKDVAPGFYVKPLHGEGLPAQIKIDVKETPDAYAVEAEVPGVSREDIQVTIDGPVVTLRAEIRQQDSQSEGEKLLRSERYYGAVSRSFQLPQDIDNATSKAKYENGVSAADPAEKTANGWSAPDDRVTCPHAPPLRGSLPPEGADPAWGSPAPDRQLTAFLSHSVNAAHSQRSMVPVRQHR